MEILTSAISLGFLIGLICSPILTFAGLSKLNVRYKFLIYLAVGVVSTAGFTLTFAWV
jgi:hypothetical protein